MTRLSLTLLPITHNSSRWLPAFFQSWQITLSAASFGDALGAATLLADSGSTDDTLAVARTVLPETQTVAYGNIGFGAAANRAIAAVSSQWVLLCNPDITFAPACLRELLAPLLDSTHPLHQASIHAACIAPKLLNPNGTPQPSVGEFPTIRAMLRDQFRPRPQRKYVFPQPTTPISIDWATGACLLIHREKFLAIGGFDERFFLYVEEVDLQRRLADKGQRTFFNPAALVTHHHPNAARAPRPQVQRWAALGQRRYFAKHGTFSQLLAYRLVAFASGRLQLTEALAPRAEILKHATGP